MSDFLEMTNSGQHRQHRFDQHPGISFAPLAGFEVGGMPVFLNKAPIAKDGHRVSDTVDQVMESGPVMHIGGVTVPIDDQSQVVEQDTLLAADNPAPVRFTLAPDLLLATPFATGMKQFNAKAINQPEQRGLSH